VTDGERIGAGPGWSIGVEEEFLLVDPDTGGTVPAAGRVLRAAGRLPAAAADAALQPELLATQVEAATGRCVTLAELIAERYAGVVAEYEACGCHVHVGVPDPEIAVGVVNHVRPWLPTLLALSVNSPVYHGIDTGYASWRMVEQSRFPGSGVPPRFTSARDYTTRVDRLVSAGALADPAQSFWLVRPSRRLPTVEFRVADVSVDIDGALLQAALSRAIVRTALADLAAGRPAPEVDDQVAAAAVWSAARYGLDGPAVHPLHACRVPAADLVADLLDVVRPALVATGDLPEVERLVAGLVTGAARQRSAGAPTEVVKMLADSALYEGDPG
jgi:carboxylate-amine ligase